MLRPFTASVRARILAWIIGVAALGMLVSGFVTYTVLIARVDEQTDRRLAQELAEFAARDWRLAASAHGMVRADRQRLTQALVQLADNAAKHTADGDTIVIGSERRDGVVRLSIDDAGPGVKPADTERIFERFTRGHDAVGRDGSGLGLAIVRAIAEAHGGQVTLGRGGQGGARFTLEIPDNAEAAR